MRSFDPSLSIRRLSSAQLLTLTAMAVLLAVADLLPQNPYLDADDAGFALSIIFGVWAILLALRARLTAIDAAAWRNRLILLTITLIVTLIAAEYLTRLVFRDVTTSSDNGGYFSRRWNSGGHISLNASGFRGRPAPSPAWSP